MFRRIFVLFFAALILVVGTTTALCPGVTKLTYDESGYRHYEFTDDAGARLDVAITVFSIPVPDTEFAYWKHDRWNTVTGEQLRRLGTLTVDSPFVRHTAGRTIWASWSWGGCEEDLQPVND